MSAIQTPKRRRLQPEDRRDAILDAAQDLFRTRGWDAVTVADVLAVSGLSKGGFYHHFAAKESLLAALVQRTAAKAMRAGDAARRDIQGDALARLNAFLEGSMRWQAENAEEMRVLIEILTQPGNDLLVHKIFAATQSVVMPVLHDLIGEGVRGGVFDVTDTCITAELVFGLPHGRRAALAEAVGAAARGDLDAAVQLLEHRLAAEAAACDRLLGLPGGSVRMSHPDDHRRMLAGLVGSDRGAG